MRAMIHVSSIDRVGLTTTSFTISIAPKPTITASSSAPRSELDLERSNP
jgi:hypothetical protein